MYRLAGHRDYGSASLFPTFAVTFAMALALLGWRIGRFHS
jgi:hypothetical protein